jgi:murein DD-endopeptidase MepM/ murein hydrolase activator NlpD
MEPERAPSFSGRELADRALHWLPLAWLGAYLAGLAWHAAQHMRTWRRWQAVLRGARIVGAAELRHCAAMTPSQRNRIAAARLTVRTIDLPVSPLLYGVRKPCLLLPARLWALDASQQQLIVEHELAHWRRADPAWLALSSVLALLFWFNRPYRRLDTALREAVELGCDDAVLAGRPATERQSYAAALVAQLRLQAQWQAPVCAAAAFGAPGVAGRVQRMRAARPPRLSVHGRMLAGAAVGALAMLGAALQPAFSSAAPTTIPATAAALPATVAQIAQVQQVPEAWRYPLTEPRVTSLYGVRSPSRPKGHNGIDFKARRGTQIVAVAAGSVSETGFDPAWGHYVRVDHGSGRSSLLIHLERIDVAPGQRVVGGEPLGTSGASGKATGPHLHLEYWQDGQRLDPALVLSDLLAHATPKALAQRKAQGNPVPTDH